MKKFDKLVAIFLSVYLLISLTLPILFQRINRKESSEYKVEINRIYLGLVKGTPFTEPDLSSCEFIKSVVFFPETLSTRNEDIDKFYKSANGMEYEIKPWYNGDKLLGYLRFNYINSKVDNSFILKVELLLFMFAVSMISILLYIRNSILKPFNTLSKMPYELSKGNLKEDMKESKDKYFGRFIWGINLLRENINYHNIKELKLQKEKKLLLISISHDIQTPLNTIKLYAKAIAEEVYDTNEKKILAAKQIQEKSLEIESFVKDIIKTSSEDVVDIEVIKGEFYLKDLMDKVMLTYREKCNLKMIDFIVEDYNNKLIKGDLDRAFEVIGNILENAFKYGDGKEIKISFCEEDYCQLIKIFNTGAVLSQNEFNHIFDSFYRASNSEGKQGNGLGLYICKYIMKKMDGEIFAECEREGMIFTLVFR